MQVKDCTEHARYQLVLERGEKVIETLTNFCMRRKIRSGTLQGLGAVRDIEIGYYDLNSKEYRFKTYEDDLEVISLIGNVSLVKEDLFVHAHVALGDAGMQCVGGHLKECTVAVTLEVHLITYHETFMRKYNDDIGLNLHHFNIQEL